MTLTGLPNVGPKLAENLRQQADFLPFQFPLQHPQLQGPALVQPFPEDPENFSQVLGGKLFWFQSAALRLQGRVQHQQAEQALFRPGGTNIVVPQAPDLGLELAGWGQISALLLFFCLANPAL